MSRRFRYLPLTVRLETVGGVATPLVLRGTPLPATRSQVFSTTADNQTSVQFSLVLGERPLSKHNVPIGTLHLRDIPRATRRVSISLAITINETCAFTVRASIEDSKLSVEEKFNPPNEFTDEFVAKIIALAGANRASDEASLRLIEATNYANALIARAEERLRVKPDNRISDGIAGLGLALEAENAERIREHSTALQAVLDHVDMIDGLHEIVKSWRTQITVPKIETPKSQPGQGKPSPKQVLTSTLNPQILGKIFGSGSFTLDPQLCFVLMPFAKKFQPIFDDHILPTVKKAGLRCERADEIRGVQLITWDIWECVNRARFLIAELTDQNANVFYELGLAHALSKDVILLAQSMDFVPFDLKALRCICYEFTPRGTQRLERELSETIQSLMKAG